MSGTSALNRADVVAMLATFRNRAPEEVGESVDSLELARLVYEVELRYAVELDLDDEQLTRMATVSGAVEVLGQVLTDGAVAST